MPGQKTPPALATVTVGEVSYEDFGNSNYVEPGQIGPIADCMILNHYERDGHTFMSSLTSPEPFNDSLIGFVKIANDTVLWVCEWTVCAMQGTNHPPVPDPVPPPGWILMDVQLTPAMTTLGPSGIDAVYRISGVYVYGCKGPQAKVFDDVRYPIAPWVKQGTIPRLVPLTALNPYLKSPDGGGGSNQGLGGTVKQGGANGQGLTAPVGFMTRG